MVGCVSLGVRNEGGWTRDGVLAAEGSGRCA